MVVLCLLGLFLASCIAIVVGYLNTKIGINSTAIGWVYEEIPIISAAGVMTLVAPGNIFVSFFMSRGKYNDYKNAFYMLGYLAPFIVILVMLPGKLDTPKHLGYHNSAMIFLAGSANLLFCRILARRAWIAGGRYPD